MTEEDKPEPQEYRYAYWLACGHVITTTAFVDGGPFHTVGDQMLCTSCRYGEGKSVGESFVTVMRVQ